MELCTKHERHRGEEAEARKPTRDPRVILMELCTKEGRHRGEEADKRILGEDADERSHCHLHCALVLTTKRF